MKLKVTQLRDLALFLDRVPQRELPSTADVRKCVGAVEQIRKVVKKEAEEYEKLYDQAKVVNKPNIEAIAKAKGDMSDDEAEKDPKVKALVKKGNEDLAGINKGLAALDEKYKDEEREIEMDENYKAFIKENWEKFIRPQFVAVKEMLAVAEALNI